MPSTDFGWGGGAWGGSSWGTGEADLELVSARAVRENVVSLTFSTTPLFNRLGTARDASIPSHYSIRPVSGVGIDGEPVRPVLIVSIEPAADEGATLELTTDRPLTGWPAVYRVSATGLVSTEGSYLIPGSSQTFLGMRMGESPVGVMESLIAGRDIANPQSFRDLYGTAPAHPELALGTYQVGPNGDYVSDHPFASYRKRVIRRVTSLFGGFAHLQNYGVGANSNVKKQSSALNRQTMASRAEQQVKLEPETISCSVSVVQVEAITYLRVRAVTNLQPDEVAIDVPVG